MRTDLIEAVELEFMEALGDKRPLPAGVALDTLARIIWAHSELTGEERGEVFDFGVEFVSTENYLTRLPPLSEDDEASEAARRGVARALEMLHAGLI